MAYQTLPNTFVSGSTIYSTAVSANMVALLQGYTSGSYDGNFSDLAAKQVTIKGAYYINSGGTANLGNTTVATLTAGDVSASSVASSGDVYTAQWTSYSPNPTNVSVSMSTGYYRSTGRLVHCSINVLGRASSDGSIGMYLPATAAANCTVNGWSPMLWMSSAGASQQYPAYGSIAPDNKFMYVYPSSDFMSFTSGVTYGIWGEFWYESA